MRSHRFINSLLYFVIQLVVKESNARENNAGIRRFFVLFLDKLYISQVIHFEELILFGFSIGFCFCGPIFVLFVNSDALCSELYQQNSIRCVPSESFVCAHCHFS